MTTSNYDFKTALVTGGGGGIGKAISQQLIKDGKKVIIAGRTESSLRSTSKEIDINIRGPMHLAVEMLAHLKSKPNALIVNVSSVLGFIPFSVVNPVYCATKSWLHFWSMSLREQLKDSKVSVVEMAPPTVATDLHRERSNPDDNKKENNPDALSAEDFVAEVIGKWKQGDEMISAGPGNKMVDTWEGSIGKLYEQMVHG